MWECGLKHNLFYAVTTDLDVTPYVGVWIETFKTRSLVSITLSLLMWECGLKPLHIVYLREQPLVTPYVGVWIETGVAGLISDTT